MSESQINMAETLTPMMRQYLEIKSQHQDAIVFYRLGDFYEMFFEDAITASQILELTLTSRNKNSDNPVPMCGVPHHASEGYIAKLVRKGKKVVICDQVEDAALAKGLVKRDITRVITPGTVLEDHSLIAKTHNYIAALTQNTDGFCLVLSDVSTGHLEYTTALTLPALKDELTRLPVREVIYPEHLRTHQGLKSLWDDLPGLYQQAQSDLHFDADFAQNKIVVYYNVATVATLGLIDISACQAIGGLLSYLEDSKVLKPALLAQPVQRLNGDCLILDDNALQHLEIFDTMSNDQNVGSFLWHMDQCQTNMGSRCLSDMIRKPLVTAAEIENRYNAIQTFLDVPQIFENLRNALGQVYDIERIVNRFITNKANARDAVALKDSLESLETLKTHLQTVQDPLVQNIKADFQDFSLIKKKIERTLVAEPPLQLKESGLIQDGVNAELDELRAIEKNGKTTILQMEAREKERTGISSLKIRYNNVFGYYIEITNTHKDKAPADYTRKQTLSNAERFITEELKTYEAKVLGASDRIKTLEYEIFMRLRDDIITRGTELKAMASAIGLLDAILSLTHVAKTYKYVKPKLTHETFLELSGARHPIIENMLKGESFVPNDITLDATGISQLIITGPNMAGKSTLMRMTALIVLMAQMGSFVPCDAATIGLCDRIFTRVGAHDSLQKGLSTFMVEMVETAKILREATPKSLVILDEVGRGTSTFDGLSIAWAISEDLHDRLKARTLFATHYHELCDLAGIKRGIANAHMQVKEYKDQVLFLRKLMTGGTNRSLGIAVAQMAGLPLSVIKRAKDILKLLEQKDLSFQSDVGETTTAQPGLFQNDKPTPSENATLQAIIDGLKNLDLNQTTPLEAIGILAAWQKRTL